MSETATLTDAQRLAAEFPRPAISWRAQRVRRNRDGHHEALALAYVDARDVMDRLDQVCGVGGWRCYYQFSPDSTKTICTLSLRVRTEGGGQEWVDKADGAGDTDIEAEKGALSDAFKRAAVRWGIGRYLYSLPAVWVPCLVDDRGKWRGWDVDPWASVDKAALSRAPGNPPPAAAAPHPVPRAVPPAAVPEVTTAGNVLQEIVPAAALEDWKQYKSNLIAALLDCSSMRDHAQLVRNYTPSLKVAKDRYSLFFAECWQLICDRKRDLMRATAGENDNAAA